MKAIIIILLLLISKTDCTETQTATVTGATEHGYYLQFCDNSGGWFLETSVAPEPLQQGQLLRLLIDTKGTADIDDDEITDIVVMGVIP